MKKYKVTMQMFKETLTKVNDLHKIIGLKSRSDVVRISIDLTKMIFDLIANGGQLILKENSGLQKKIIINNIKKNK